MTIFWAIEKLKSNFERLQYDREIRNFLENTKNRAEVLINYQEHIYEETNI